MDWVNALVGAEFRRVTNVVTVDDFLRNIAGNTLKRVLLEQYGRR